MEQRGEQGVREHGKHKRKVLARRDLTIPSHVQRQQVATPQPPLATEFPLEDMLVAVFFRVSDLTTANAQLSTDSIEMPNTDMNPKLFL